MVKREKGVQGSMTEIHFLMQTSPAFCVCVLSVCGWYSCKFSMIFLRNAAATKPNKKQQQKINAQNGCASIEFTLIRVASIFCVFCEWYIWSILQWYFSCASIYNRTERDLILHFSIRWIALLLDIKYIRKMQANHLQCFVC